VHSPWAPYRRHHLLTPAWGKAEEAHRLHTHRRGNDGLHLVPTAGYGFTPMRERATRCMRGLLSSAAMNSSVASLEPRHEP
jgi:hypothetical protein